MSAVLPSISVEPLETLAHEWAELWRSIPDATPFNHPSWVTAWLRSQRTPTSALASGPLFLAIRVEDSLIGVASVMPDQRVTTNIGDSSVTDYAFPLAAPGQEETVAAGVLEWLVEDLTTGLDLWGMPADSSMRPAFRAAAERFGWGYHELDEAVCPRVSLPGDFDGYVASLAKHDRHELRRKMRRLEASGNVRYESVIGGHAILARIERLLELMRLSHADKYEFLTKQRVTFFRELALTLGDLGIARLGTLTVDGSEAAMVFCFEDETTTYLYNSGYDPTFSHSAVGLVSKAYAIRDSIERGQKTFDFLRGDEEYKRHLGGRARRVLTLRLRA